MTLIFDELAPSNVSKDALNHFLVNSSAKDSLRTAKNVVFFLFFILVDRPMGGAIAPPPRPPPLVTLLTMLLPIRISIALEPCTLEIFATPLCQM